MRKCAPHFSFRKKNGPHPVQKEIPGGFRFFPPRTPLKRLKGAGCGPPLWIPLPEGCKPVNHAPHERLAKRNARRGCRVSACFARYALGIYRAAKEKDLSQQICTGVFSLWTVNGPFLFWQDQKRNGGFLRSPRCNRDRRAPLLL